MLRPELWRQSILVEAKAPRGRKVRVDSDKLNDALMPQSQPAMVERR
jgi:hypothetical protein